MDRKMGCNILEHLGAPNAVSVDLLLYYLAKALLRDKMRIFSETIRNVVAHWLRF